MVCKVFRVKLRSLENTFKIRGFLIFAEMRKRWLKELSGKGFKFDNSAAVELQKSEAMQKKLKSYGLKVKDAAGIGYQVEEELTETMAKVIVRATSPSAVSDSLINNTLVNALNRVKE